MGIADYRMDFYVKDFLTSTLDLTGMEAAVYLATLAVAWTHDAQLPLDPERIRLMVRLDPDEWALVWPAIEHKWPVVGDHRENGRQRRVRAETEDRIAMRSQSGRKASAMRWGMRSQSEGNANGDAVALRTVSPSQSQSQSRRSLSHPPSPEPPDFAAFWSAYPRKVKRPKALLAWRRLPDPDRAAILAVLPSWPFDHREAGRFIPYPEAWLNGRRWEDAPDPLPPLPAGSHGSATPAELYAAASTPSDEDLDQWRKDAEADLAASGFSRPKGQP